MRKRLSPLLTHRLLLGCLFTLLCIPTGLHAFPYTVTDKNYNIRLTQSFERSFESDLDVPSDGELEIDRSHTNLNIRRAWKEGYIDINGFYEYSDYDFSQNEVVGIGRDWGFEFAALQHINRNWSGIGSLRLHFGQEKDADLGKSFLVDFMGGAQYAFSDSFRMSFGLLYQRELESFDLILPFVSFDWQITDNVRFHTRNGIFLDADLMGDGRSVFKTHIQIQRRQFRLDGASDELAVDETHWEIGASLRQTIYAGFYIEPYFDYMFAREFSVYEDGDKEFERDVESGFKAGISGGWKF